MPNNVAPVITRSGFLILPSSRLIKEYKIYPDINPAVFAMNNSITEAQLTYIENDGVHTRYKIEKEISSPGNLSLVTIFFMMKYQTGIQRIQPKKENKRISLRS